MQVNTQILVLVLLSLSTFQSGSVCADKDVVVYTIGPTVSWQRRCETTPSVVVPRQPNVMFEATGQIKQWLLDNLIRSVCTVSNNLFAVYVSSASSSQSYSAQVVRIDPRQFTRWNTTLLNPFGVPKLPTQTLYLLFSNQQLPVVRDSDKLNLGTMPELTLFIPLVDLRATLDTAYQQCVNSIGKPGFIEPRCACCSRLDSLNILVRLTTPPSVTST
ncbi:unnamed protein product [Echinostoma caproni]|uniref:Secreted protein n=1 Tax=Echinostoma caproni TaxID=27848 RepID=A0A183AKX6_9TREM|nr:unnamed protein product [Echinostoma caproni]